MNSTIWWSFHFDEFIAYNARCSTRLYKCINLWSKNGKEGKKKVEYKDLYIMIQ